MMEKLIYKNGRGERIVFSPRSPFWVDIKRDVKGLNDIVNELYLNQTNGQNASVYGGYKHKEKEIHIKGRIYAKNRRQSEQYVNLLNKALFLDENSVLLYENEGHIRSIRCIAEVAPLYSIEEVLSAFSIELKCLEQYWRDDAEVNSLLANWHPMLEFPLCIDTEDGIEFGVREESLIINVLNEGDVDTAVLIRFTAMGDVENPEIININTGEYIKLGIHMQYGDTIEVNTHVGKKAVYLYRNGQKSNIISLLARGSTFLKLHPKDNLFRYDAASGINALDISIRHNNLYLTCYAGGSR